MSHGAIAPWNWDAIWKKVNFLQSQSLAAYCFAFFLFFIFPFVCRNLFRQRFTSGVLAYLRTALCTYCHYWWKLPDGSSSATPAGCPSAAPPPGSWTTTCGAPSRSPALPMCSSAHRACGETRLGPASELNTEYERKRGRRQLLGGKNFNKVDQNYTAGREKRTDTHGPCLQLKLPVVMIHLFLCSCNEVTREAGRLSHASGSGWKFQIFSQQDYASNTSNGAHRMSGWWLQKGQSSWPWCCPCRPWAPAPAGGATLARLEKKEKEPEATRGQCGSGWHSNTKILLRCHRFHFLWDRCLQLWHRLSPITCVSLNCHGTNSVLLLLHSSLNGQCHLRNILLLL